MSLRPAPAVLVCLALPLAAQGKPFGDVPLPALLGAPEEGAVTSEAFGEAEFPVSSAKQVTKQGRHVRAYLPFASGSNPGAAATWRAWQPLLAQAGFAPAGSDGATTYTLKRVAGGRETWIKVALADYNDPLLEVIELQGKASGLALPPPAAQPEKPGEGADFPYLLHPDGARLTQTSVRPEPLDLTVPGLDREPVLAGTTHTVKFYSAPSTLSRLEFDRLYREALAQAGWTVAPAPPGARPGESPLVARYAKNGRALAVRLERGDPSGDTGIRMAVADLGGEDWAAKLDKDCHLPLYGVLFDFNKATLKPESEPVLRKALDLLKARPDLKVEVQGHTDAVGSEAANQALSEARAASVAAWLAGHGVAAGRVSSAGYGKRQPVAPNDTDAGRARNRRVELKKQGCGS